LQISFQGMESLESQKINIHQLKIYN